MPRRSRTGIIYDILESLENGELNLTALMNRANLPYDRFKELINDMERNGLVKKSEESGKVIYSITRKGKEALEELRRVRNVLKTFGIELE